MGFKPTFLYIKTHVDTGLKYFGKSVKETIEEVEKYKGSGIQWNNHLKEFGNNVTTEIYGYFEDRNECKAAARQFSIDNNIVESDEWANNIIENGLNGGALNGEKNGMYGKKHSEESAYKCGNAFRGKSRPDHSEKMKGENNPMYGKSDHAHGLQKRASEILKGNTYEEIFGEEGAKIIKEKLSLAQTGKKHNLKERICPHCSKVGKGPNMTRYHFENCKEYKNDSH